MQTTKLGRTGLDVSRLCLGCMSYGEPDRGNHSWTLGEAASRPFLKKALDLGINFFDTANVYSAGSSEEIVGRALLGYARRGEIVIATKVNQRMHKGPNGMGLSRKAIFAEIVKALAEPAVREQLIAQGLTPRGSSADELGRATKDQLAKYAALIKKNGIKAE